MMHQIKSVNLEQNIEFKKMMNLMEHTVLAMKSNLKLLCLNPAYVIIVLHIYPC